MRQRGGVHTCRWKAVWVGCEVTEVATETGVSPALANAWLCAIDHITLPSTVVRDLKKLPSHRRGQVLQAHQNGLSAAETLMIRPRVRTPPCQRLVRQLPGRNR